MFHLAMGIGEIAIYASIAILMLQVLFFVKSYKKSPPDSCLIRTGMGGAKVAFDMGLPVFPIIHSHDILNISAKFFDITTPVTFKDDVKKDFTVTFAVRVNKTKEDVLMCVQMLGLEKLNDEKKLTETFKPKFEQHMQSVATLYESIEVNRELEKIRDQLLDLIGADLNGLCLEDVSIHPLK